MKINLRELRDKAKRRDDSGKAKSMTRDELAIMLSDQIEGKKMHPTQIARYEDEPGSVPMELLLPWLRCLGTSLEEQLLAFSKQAAEQHVLNPGTPYAWLGERLQTLKEYLDVHRSFVAADEANGLPKLEDLQMLMSQLGRKPNVVLSGAFDAGKTTLANWLLSSQSLVERYQPTTAAVTYVRHISERPAWLDDDVVLLGQAFDSAQWQDEQHVDSVQLGRGGMELLRERAIHVSEDQRAQAPARASYALVFMNSPILHACNIIDHPGFNNEQGDDALAERALREFDVLIFASTTGGFMSSPDLMMLREFIRRLPVYEKLSPDFPTLGNLYMVATHAGPQLSDAQLYDERDGLLQLCAERIWREMHETDLASRAADSARLITAEVVRSRMFTFWRENRERSSALENDLLKLLSEHIPQCAKIEANNQIGNFRKTAVERMTAAVAFYQASLSNSEKMRAQYEKKLEEEVGARQQRQILCDELFALIQESKASHLKECQRLFAERVNPARLEKDIRARYDDKKEAQQHMGNYVYAGLHDDLQTFGKQRAERVMKLVENYLSTYANSLEFDPGDNHAVSIPFDARGSFIGGFVGLTSVGALAIWASNLGNLGGYILAARAVSILSMLGIGVGGTASAMSAVAGLGGPVSLAIALAVVLFSLLRALFGEDWQIRLAKQLHDHFQKKEVLATMMSNISEYWDSTHQAFENGAKKVEQDYLDSLQKMEQLLSSSEQVAQAENAIQRFTKAREFFAGMPGFYG